MARLDRYAIDHLAIPGLILMENAGRDIAATALRMLQSACARTVHIYCGAGNNGGDGYVIARHLANHGYDVTTYILAPREKIKGDALTNLLILEKMAMPVHYIERVPATDRPALVIDAMLGTGVSGPLQGLYAEIVEFINQLQVPALAVDIPTGVNADTGAVPGPAIHADVTCTMAYAKPGLLLPPGREHCGELEIMDISLPQQALAAQPVDTWLLQEQDIAERLPKRARDSHKNRVGTVAVIAGSTGYCGAASLTATACLRSGAGLSYLAIPKSLNTIFAGKLTEVVLWPCEDSGRGYLGAGNLEELISRIEPQNALAIGPGLGQAEATGQLLFALLASLNKPVVLDADGLNLVSRNIDAVNTYQGPMVLTPHPGELARLIGKSTQQIAADRIAVARQTAIALGKVLVLKGSPTVIAEPAGKVYINSSGNAGMATAGSGDVLTGAVAALLAQGLSALDAALVGVYIHGAAGDLAREQKGEMGMIARDILAMLPRAFARTGRVDAAK
jgi:NAD(P)H-hydrate epimerase